MPHALVYGGAGALGRSVVSQFRQANWTVVSLDFAKNDDAHTNILLDKASASSLSASGSRILADVSSALPANTKLDAIITVAGGWAGGNLADDSLFESTEMMISQSVHTSIIAAKLAARHLREGGLLTLTGASAATHGTPGMWPLIAYGMAKAAVHQLVKSAAGPNSGLPAGAKVTAITLDTPMNRKFMADADTSTWTPLDDISSKFLAWAESKEAVDSGSLFRLVTANSKTDFVPVI
ncbi:dihydropteridine reductase-like protein [Entophlyctis helioformis]|nr:dihydropteridine reductase-like protein [Entophlyctis helioformis]